ncbi:hypothetical protein B9Z19DRAFT_1092529, partial [Tuber borchii]
MRALLFFFFPFSSFLEPLAEGMILYPLTAPLHPSSFLSLLPLLCLLALAAFGGFGI